MLPPLFKESFSIIHIGNEQLAWAVLGFRIFDCLWSGKTLYIEDLVTLPSHTKRGFATQLFDWIIEYAKQMQCDHLALNSGFQRRDAYRFYLNQGLFIESMHFGRKVNEL
jgi:GNAT superfamily N-acetyltransferase